MSQHVRAQTFVDAFMFASAEEVKVQLAERWGEGLGRRRSFRRGLSSRTSVGSGGLFFPGGFEFAWFLRHGKGC
jgi:hypothetical protein